NIKMCKIFKIEIIVYMVFIDGVVPYERMY
ncbi:MAG: hypothetical protein K0Q53_2485, partial [Massilibacillus sp.]|nr:hypothetical protein [Massilibacillus sp.]